MSIKALQSSIQAGSCPSQQVGTENQCSTQHLGSVEGMSFTRRAYDHHIHCAPAAYFRICPGKHLAPGSVWIAVATMLSTLHITKAKDERGNEITPLLEFDRGLVRYVYFCILINRLSYIFLSY